MTTQSNQAVTPFVTIGPYRATTKSGAQYWIANGFLFFNAENRGVQLPIMQRYKLWRALKRQIRQEMATDLQSSDKETK